MRVFWRLGRMPGVVVTPQRSWVNGIGKIIIYGAIIWAFFSVFGRL